MTRSRIRDSVFYDVIVVGTRCAGAPLAMLLARAGYRVLAVDRARFPSDTMSTHWILRPGVELLASWELLDRLVVSGCPPVEHLRLDFGDVVLSGTPMAGDGPATTYAPRRTVLDALLVEAARNAGAEVLEGVSVRDVLRRENAVTGVTGHTADGRPFLARARLVVGADGRNSTIARAVGAPMTDDRGALAATVYGYWSGVRTDGAETFVRPGRGAAVWPTHDDLTVVALTLPRQEYRDGARNVYLRTLTALPSLHERLATGRLVGEVRGAANLRNFCRRSHGAGWALLGDAGQHKDPIGAHGISDAFTDAAGLARAIDEGLGGRMDLDRSLARYAARRDAGRSAVFEFICRQASLRPLDADFTRLLHQLRDDREAAAEFLQVSVGSRRIEDFFGPAGRARRAESARRAATAGQLPPPRG
ncbi:NAD(P)/FAD-dependent oxidoreductase [Streptomyces sp. NPDC004270]